MTEDERELMGLRVEAAISEAEIQWTEKADKRYASKHVETILYSGIGIVAALILSALVSLVLKVQK